MDEDTARRYPEWTRLSPELVQAFLQDTLNGHYDLLPTETIWRDLKPTLKQRGYHLRSRYDAQWRPSWLGTDINPYWCEDSIKPITSNVMDATRDDGLSVAIKRVDRKPGEIEVARFFSSSELGLHPSNHCVPILDAFSDPVTPDSTYLVMPNLRPFDDPQFTFVGEVVDFVEQTLEGLQFMHEHNVAHLGCSEFTIMMDATRLYPQGWHPLRRDRSPDLLTKLPAPPSRISRPVRYYFTSFSHSIHFPPGAFPTIPPNWAIPQEDPVPGLCVDAYKADVYMLGCVYRRALCREFTGLDFLQPLVSGMTERDTGRRLSAADALALFRRMRKPLYMRRRLRPVHKTVSGRDAVAAVTSIVRPVDRTVEGAMDLV
ncbi:hypothetical protein PLICRDRAFT_35229 [Plicaturopsis crispa FD-325 SS-3]|nr:hypothetical protein PLICRDRAFT_35229 [Plicaturopsis crispa FD-325 SS-3]